MTVPTLSVLIPAAGASRRLGQAKQLVNYRGETLIARTVRHALSLSPLETIVVTGANRELIAEAIDVNHQEESIRTVHNPLWTHGMGKSIAVGASAIHTDAQGVLVVLCDQWRIRSRDLTQLLQAWRMDTRQIVCARVDECCGPPVIFPASCFALLRDLNGDRGAHGIIDAHPDLLCPLPLDNAAGDLDTPSQLEALQAESTA